MQLFLQLKYIMWILLLITLFWHQAMKVIRLFSQPLGIPGCTIKYRCGFEHLELAALCVVGSFRKQYPYLLVGHWFKRADGFAGLVQNLHAVDTGNNSGSR